MGYGTRRLDVDGLNRYRHEYQNSRGILNETYLAGVMGEGNSDMFISGPAEPDEKVHPSFLVCTFWADDAAGTPTRRLIVPVHMRLVLGAKVDKDSGDPL